MALQGKRVHYLCMGDMTELDFIVRCGAQYLGIEFHEAKRNIIIEPNNAGTATCPECGTEYDIAAYGGTGAPVNVVSKYPLRRYTVSSNSSSGQEWVVIN